MGICRFVSWVHRESARVKLLNNNKMFKYSAYRIEAQVNLIKIKSAPDLVERVHASLLYAISDGTLVPGARFMQEEIAEKLAARARYQLDAQLIITGRSAARGLDIKAMMTADSAFHMDVCAALGNLLIAQLHKHISTAFAVPWGDAARFDHTRNYRGQARSHCSGDCKR